MQEHQSEEETAAGKVQPYKSCKGNASRAAFHVLLYLKELPTGWYLHCIIVSFSSPTSLIAPKSSRMSQLRSNLYIIPFTLWLWQIKVKKVCNLSPIAHQSQRGNETLLKRISYITKSWYNIFYSNLPQNNSCERFIIFHRFLFEIFWVAQFPHLHQPSYLKSQPHLIKKGKP